MRYDIRRMVAAIVVAAMVIGGCGTSGASGEAAAEVCETCEAAVSEFPASFTNLAAEAVLTQSANEETHVQTNVLDLGSEETVGYLRILWPDLNVQEYTIEGSLDGETYETLYTRSGAPYYAEDCVELDAAVQARYIRMSGIAASALPVPEVYAEDPWTSIEDALEPYLAEDGNGHKVLAITGLTDCVEYVYGGCNYEEVIAALPEDLAASGAEDDESSAVVAVALIEDTIADRTVSVGFTLSVDMETGKWTHDTRDYEVFVPAQDRQGTSADLKEGAEEAAALGFNACPEVIPSLQEWQGGKGTVSLSREEVERIQASDLTAADGRAVSYEIVSDTSLGDEGYRIDIGCASAEDENAIRVYANTETGLYWGNVTLRQMIVLAENDAATDDAGTDAAGVLAAVPNADAGDDTTPEQAATEKALTDGAGTGVGEDTTGVTGTDVSDDAAASNEDSAVDGATASAEDSGAALPRGRIRDYPIGKVRGIMLDVGRNTMSLSQVEQIARNLSWFKMNELTLHLQDNALLTYSDRTDSVENARTAYSAYRMESAITGEDGTSITAEDLSYTAEEFAALVETCAGFGVSIIPEIDTPAHSLALTSAFPDLGLSGRPDAVDMLDCSNAEALELACRVWDEQLSGAFADVTTIQIGGDEYYGQGSDFVNYEAGLIDHLSSSGKTLRMWGSLTALMGETRISPIVPGSWRTPDEADDAEGTAAAADAADDEVGAGANAGDPTTAAATADIALTDSVKRNIECNDKAAEDDAEATADAAENIAGAGTAAADDGAYDALADDADTASDVGNAAGDGAGEATGTLPDVVDIVQQQAAEEGTLPAERIQMQLWSTYWADPMTMYRAGFDLINSSSDRLYINCGEATDYLDKESIYTTYHRTEYAMTDGTTETLPSWSPRLIGSSAALWNDLIDNLEIGISEYDMTDRVLDAMPVIAEVFWQEDGARTYAEWETAAEVLRVAPDADPLHQRDDLLLGPDYKVSFEVYLPSDVTAEDADYNIFAVDVDGNSYEYMARQYDGDGEGQVGFSREFYDYAFDYTLPTDTWVRLTVVGHKDVTELYADGELVATLGSSEAYEEHATFLFPTQVNEAFVGEVRSVVY